MTPAERQSRYRKLAKKRRRASNVEWYTPPEIIALAVEVMGGIDVDPASCAAANEVVGAKVFYDLHADGLAQPWHGRVWLNPPYSNIASFVAKLIDEVAAGRVTEAILLTSNATDAAWFQKASAWSSTICFPNQRIKFEAARRQVRQGVRAARPHCDPGRQGLIGRSSGRAPRRPPWSLPPPGKCQIMACASGMALRKPALRFAC